MLNPQMLLGSKRAQGYGSWTSPIDGAAVARSSIEFEEVRVDDATRGADGLIYFSEVRPTENGRVVVCSRCPDGQLLTWTVSEHSVRTRVNEFGGGAFFVYDRAVFYINEYDQCLYMQESPDAPPLLIGEEGLYADAVYDPLRGVIIAVHENRSDKTSKEPITTIVSISIKNRIQKVLVSGSDFYSSPRISCNGKHLAWIEWSHPNQPWDNTELWVADLNSAGDGVLSSTARLMAGGNNESVMHPTFTEDGNIFFLSDKTGFWNVYCGLANGKSDVRNILPLSFDVGLPPWYFGKRPYDVAADGSEVFLTYIDKTGSNLVAVKTNQSDPDPLPIGTGYTYLSSLVCNPLDKVYMIAGSPQSLPVIIEVAVDVAWSSAPPKSAKTPEEPRRKSLFDMMESYIEMGLEKVNQATGGALDEATSIVVSSITERLATKPASVVVRSGPEELDFRYISMPEIIEYTASNGQAVYCHLYRPTNKDYEGTPGELPPLILCTHEGPFHQHTNALSMQTQYWSSHGFAVADVNFTGSAGRGRAFRRLVWGKWALADVDDVINVANYLASNGWVDKNRMVVTGTSFGALTALSALTLRDVFKAGISLWGIGDLMALSGSNHKFEKHIVDRLIGPLPDSTSIYRDRSPINQVSKLRSPVLFLHGQNDSIVPCSQSEAMFEAASRKGLPCALVVYEGESHGICKATHIAHMCEAQLYFISRVLGLRQPSDLAPTVHESVDIHNQTRLCDPAREEMEVHGSD